MKNILVVGSVAFDTITTPAGRAENILGGSATYFSVAASLFTSVRLVAVVGEDFTDEHHAIFKGRNINTDGLSRENGDTFRWQGSYCEDLNNAVTEGTWLNVFETFKPELPSSVADSEYVLLANIDPDLQSAVLDQVKNPSLVVLDTMNLWIDIKRESLEKVLGRVNVAIINEGEARMLSGSESLIESARYVQNLGPEVLIIKRGEHGALLFKGEEWFYAPAYLLPDVVDPTGAGDSFAGGFLGSLARDGVTDFKALKKAALTGCVVASFTVQDFGLNRLATVTESELDERYNQIKRMISLD